MKKYSGTMVMMVLFVLLTTLAGCAAKKESVPGPLIECTGNSPIFNSDTIIVLAMHGVPPIGSNKILPQFLMLEAMAEAKGDKFDSEKRKRMEELEQKLQDWPLKVNRPYRKGYEKLARKLSQKIGLKVLIGHNEFCAPSLVKALEEAAAEKPKRILVVTTLTAPGNDHAANPKKDILKKVFEAQKKFPDIEISYAWPYRFDRLVKLLFEQLLLFTTLEELADKGTRVVVAVHGAPSTDTPKDVVMEYMMLHGMPFKKDSQRALRYKELDEKVLNWPRTKEDAYWAGTEKLGQMLGKMIGSDVIVAYNEFCAPTLPAAFQKAMDDGAKKIFVVTPMFEPENPHSRIDVRQKTHRTNVMNPDVEIKFAWPFPYDNVVACLCGQMLEFWDKPGYSVN